MNKRLLTAIIIAAVALAIWACGDADESVAPYRIGVMESLTGPGETYGTVANQSK